IARNGVLRTHLMKSDRPIPTRRAQTRIHRLILIAKVFNELESEQIAVETESTLHVLHVDHGMVERKPPVNFRADGSLDRLRSGIFGGRTLCKERILSILRRGFSPNWLLHSTASINDASIIVRTKAVKFAHKCLRGASAES